jgi:hypothetical protein
VNPKLLNLNKSGKEKKSGEQNVAMLLREAQTQVLTKAFIVTTTVKEVRNLCEKAKMQQQGY